MNLPIQSQPVIRQYSTAGIQNGAYPQGCNWWKCGTAVAKCASCLTSPTCWINCLGDLYDTCKDCI